MSEEGEPFIYAGPGICFAQFLERGLRQATTSARKPQARWHHPKPFIGDNKNNPVKT